MLEVDEIKSKALVNNVVSLNPAIRRVPLLCQQFNLDLLSAVPVSISIGAQFETPDSTILVDSEHIFVFDISSTNVQKIKISSMACQSFDFYPGLGGGMGVQAACIVGNYIYGVSNSISMPFYKINKETLVATIIGSGNGYNQICFDGQSLWLYDSYSDIVHKVDPNTYEFISSISGAPSQDAQFGVAFDGRYLWSSNKGGNKIVKVDTALNTSISIILPDTNPYSVAFDGRNIWVSSVEGKVIVKIDPRTNAFLASIPCSSYAYNIRFSGKYLYAVLGATLRAPSNVIVKIDVDRNTIVGTFPNVAVNNSFWEISSFPGYIAVGSYANLNFYVEN